MTAESLALTSTDAVACTGADTSRGAGQGGPGLSGPGLSAMADGTTPAAGSDSGHTPADTTGASCVYARLRWLMDAAKTAALVTGNWPMTPDPVYPGWTCFPRIATRTPGMDGRAVRDARDFAAATARRWGAAQQSEDIAVVVSELVTNAFRHAAPPSGAVAHGAIQLGLMQPGPYILCGVADPSPWLPVPSDPDPFAENGRGLHVVAALSDQWGYTRLGSQGKVVWALVAAGCPIRP